MNFVFNLNFQFLRILYGYCIYKIYYFLLLPRNSSCDSPVPLMFTTSSFYIITVAHPLVCRKLTMGILPFSAAIGCLQFFIQGLVKILPCTLVCCLVLLSCTSCLGIHIVEISWVQLPCHVQQTPFLSGCTGPLSRVKKYCKMTLGSVVA